MTVEIMAIDNVSFHKHIELINMDNDDEYDGDEYEEDDEEDTIDWYIILFPPP